MIISDELLAAYAEDKVTKDERDAVRKYLAENPSELESVMIMMDEDYELSLKKEAKVCPPSKGAVSAAKALSLGATPNLNRCAAAFAPMDVKPNFRRRKIIHPSSETSFRQRLDDLIDELGI